MAGHRRGKLYPQLLELTAEVKACAERVLALKRRDNLVRVGHSGWHRGESPVARWLCAARPSGGESGLGSATVRGCCDSLQPCWGSVVLPCQCEPGCGLLRLFLIASRARRGAC